MYLGVDIGSLATKAVLIDEHGKIVAHWIRPTGFDHKIAAADVLDRLLESSGATRPDIRQAVGTGYGRANIPYADRAITEITCHGRGAAGAFPEVRTVIDIGGQDSKVMGLAEKGRVLDFVMNDRCAAGTGRFLEVMARSLELSLEQMGEMAVQAKKPARISNVCTVFAESEVVSLIAAGVDRGHIVKGLCRAVSERVAAMVERVGLTPPLVMTGGVALNAGVVAAIKDILGVPVLVPPNPQIIGAYGAALLALDAEKS